jgi:hypothetical protein
MAYEDSHTLFVVRWLDRVGLHDLLRLWYDYRDELFDEKERHPRRRVYSRLYEFFHTVAEHYSDLDRLQQAYDETLDELGTIEKLPIEK